MIWLVAVACTCADPPPEPPAPPDHYSGFWPLVAAAATGDRVGAATAADQVRAEDVDDAGVGAALAMVRLAKDEVELADGVAATAAACGACHAGRPAFETRPGWDVPEGWALWGLVWNDDSPPPADPRVDPLAAAWVAARGADSDPPPDAGAARVLADVAVERRAGVEGVPVVRRMADLGDGRVLVVGHLDVGELRFDDGSAVPLFGDTESPPGRIVVEGVSDGMGIAVTNVEPM